MDRRFASIAVAGAIALLAGCAGDRDSADDSTVELNAEVDQTIERFYSEFPEGRSLADEAAGMLVFPEVTKAGLGVGGEYGEGALRVGDQIVDYYSTAAASVGLQAGAENKSEMILFMTEEALQDFRSGSGWEAGVDGTITLIEAGATGQLNTTNIQDPIVGFVFGETGLMAGVGFEGSKFTKLEKDRAA
jgi:lipid-binding SYLF domain-containing protein